MKETQFISQNRQKWSEFEDVLAEAQKSPDKLHDIYIQVTDDLSHARTFYPTRSVRAYLNGLAQAVFGVIHKQKKSPLSKFRFFFTDELPQVVYESRWSFFWATAFFILSFIIGYMSSMMDETFLKIILGDEYVQMTVENIKKGDPMAVYKSSGRFDMTFGIMANNIRVTLIYFLLGIFAGIGSVAMMMYNGIMVGAFLQFFSRHNLLGEANLTVWMHGTFEISAIIIGTAAGITMGRGLLFPSTYTRLQAFQMTARRGIKIMVGVITLLIVAALIEGNLTRHTEAGDLFRGIFILVCFVVVVGYFGWLPFYKAKKGFRQPLAEAKLPPDNFYQIDYQKIKSGGEIFGDTFLFFRRHLSIYLKIAALAAFVFCFVSYFTSSEKISETFKLQTNIFNQSSVLLQFFINENIPIMPYLNGLIITIVAFTVFKTLLRGENIHTYTRKEEIITFAEMLIIFEIWSLFSALSESIFILSIIFVLPFFGLWAYVMYRFGFNFKFFKALQHTWWLINTHLSLVIGSYLTLLLVGWLIYSLTNSSVLYFYLWMIGWNFSFLSQARLDEFVVLFLCFTSTFTIFTIFSLIFTTIGFLFYSLLEINEANNLLNRIKQIGMSRKIRGMARE
ncbi:MAG: stage II sporulation protein M [Saprospiraceae bacterium]|nr:stage II sporulation protein M [Saprospiraceae bacterium]